MCSKDILTDILVKEIVSNEYDLTLSPGYVIEGGRVVWFLGIDDFRTLNSITRIKDNISIYTESIIITQYLPSNPIQVTCEYLQYIFIDPNISSIILRGDTRVSCFPIHRDEVIQIVKNYGDTWYRHNIWKITIVYNSLDSFIKGG